MKRTPLEAAEAKGAWAARIGQNESDCPYEDKRKPDGRLTFSRAFRNAWVQGFRKEKSREQTPSE